MGARRSAGAGWLVVASLLAAPGAPAQPTGDGAAEGVLGRVRAGDVAGAVRLYRERHAPTSPQGRRVLHAIALEMLRLGVDRAPAHEQAPLAAVLAAHGDPHGYEVLEDGLRSPNRLVRQSAAEALAGVGSDRTTAILRRLYAKGPDGRLLALDALARAGNREAVDLFLHAMRSGDPALRMAAMRGIGELRVAEARTALHEVWAEDRDPVLSGYAAYCLARLGDGRALEALKARLRAPRADARDQAAALLGFFEDPTLKPLLLETLFDPSDFVRASAIASLTRLQDGTGLPLARRLLEHSEFSVRLAVAASFERMDYSVARTLVREAVHSDDPDVRALALHAIRSFGDTDSLEWVRAALRHEPDEFVRTEALLTLGAIGDDSVLSPLLEALRQEHASIRHAAAEALVTLVDRLPETPHARVPPQP